MADLSDFLKYINGIRFGINFDFFHCEFNAVLGVLANLLRQIYI